MGFVIVPKEGSAKDTIAVQLDMAFPLGRAFLPRTHVSACESRSRNISPF